MQITSGAQYDADVLIVGGGPSGAMCAYYLAKADKKVILIDAQNFPRDKICGDFVSPVGLNELRNIGVWEFASFKKTNIITGAAVYIDGTPLIAKNIPAVDGLPNYGRVIPRFILDKWIVDAAEKQGAQIITPCRLMNYVVSDDSIKIECKHEGETRHFTVKLLVGADGSNSTVARMMHGKKPDSVNKIVAVRAYYENINCKAQQAELFFTSKSFPGYYWFFPTGPTTANVGIGMMLENFPKEEINLKKLLTDMIENDPSFKARIGNGTVIDKIVGFPLSIYNPGAEIVKDRILLAGDAAGLVNSINGEGIQYAMQSGRWAAENILACFATSGLSAKSLKRFDTKVQCEIGYDMSISNIVMQFIRNRNLNPLWIKVLRVMISRAKRDEKYADIAGGILAGITPASTAIKWYFVRKSFTEAFISFFGSPANFGRFVKQGFILSGRVLMSLVNPRSWYWNWIKDILKATRASVRLYRVHANRQPVQGTIPIKNAPVVNSNYESNQ